MNANTSPWLAQLKKQRLVQVLPENSQTDVLVVGGGIAGIATAFFILKYTHKKIMLLEGYRVAHGATGHNAGQIASYFERQIASIAEEYGIEKAADAQNAIDSAWLLLQEIYDDAKLKVHFSSFTGYAGCQDREEILIHLKNIQICQKANIRSEGLIVASDHPIASEIPQEYHPFYTTQPHTEILELLETKDKNYVAAVTSRKGCMNSALFCEDVLHFLLAKYSQRFQIAEHAHVDKIVLEKEHAIAKVGEKTVIANKVILCTNGFEKFTIKNNYGDDINTKFHHLVTGSVGYMAGYLEKRTKKPIAISYLPQHHIANSVSETSPYIYVTRRDYEYENNMNHSLVCVGGPETLMDDTTNYKYSHEYPQAANNQIDEFLEKTYEHTPSPFPQYAFRWHGLMGYTPNGLRCIGPEPKNPTLLYNLGCNGVGILPSLYGGKKISQYINNEKLKPSVFDPV